MAFSDLEVIKILFLATLSFVVAIVWTPLLTHFLYKYRMGKSIRDVSANTPVFSKLHQHKEGTPVMGGLLVWVTTAVLAIIFFYLAKIFDLEIFKVFNFLTRSETLLPLGALVAASLVGLIDDFLNVKKIGPRGGGLRMSHKLLIYAAIAGFGAWWFFSKLEWDTIWVPLVGNFEIGWWYIPIFIFIVTAVSHSVNITDGLDGLAGGTLMAAFFAFGTIAFMQGKYNLAALCAVIGGALLAFLWFNINPARFFMGDTGAMGLGVTLGVIAFLTNTALLLPVIGLIFVIESASVILQTLSKKIRKKKIFQSSPIHHHFEAVGWPETKIVMRFWVIAGVAAVLGVVVYLIAWPG